MRSSFTVLFMLMVNIVCGQSPNRATTIRQDSIDLAEIQQPRKGVAKTNWDSVFLAKKHAVLNTPFPQFTATSQKGMVSSEMLKGKVVLINFWFEVCHPCMVEMAMLNQVHGELQASKDFLFISFTFDNKEAIQRVQKSMASHSKFCPPAKKNAHD
jgi:cytochrome oxidase Cu insertion factor (SCO1/SenC/PrrC family)